jgi:hypothetical protein
MALVAAVNKFHQIRNCVFAAAQQCELGTKVMKPRQPEAHRLIRNIDTGLYLSANGQWVADEEEAFDFPDLRSALSTYEGMEHHRVEMVLVFEREQRARPEFHL